MKHFVHTSPVYSEVEQRKDCKAGSRHTIVLNGRPTMVTVMVASKGSNIIMDVVNAPGPGRTIVIGQTNNPDPHSFGDQPITWATVDATRTNTSMVGLTLSGVYRDQTGWYTIEPGKETTYPPIKVGDVLRSNRKIIHVRAIMSDGSIAYEEEISDGVFKSHFMSINDHAASVYSIKAERKD